MSSKASTYIDDSTVGGESNSISRKLLVFCDGTGNDLFSKPTVTNVAIMSKLVKSDPNHVVLYFPGPGVQETATATISSLIDQITASSLDYKIKEIYSIICLNYKEGDKIYMFGFSRGSLIIRLLSNFLYFFGILKREFYSADRVKTLYNYFNNLQHISDINQTDTFGKLDFVQSTLKSISEVGLFWGEKLTTTSKKTNNNKKQQIEAKEIVLTKYSTEIDNEKMILTEPLSVTNFKLDSIEFMGMFDTVPGLTDNELKKELFFLNLKNQTWKSIGERSEYYIKRFAHIMAHDVTPHYVNWSIGFPTTEGEVVREFSEGVCCWFDSEYYYEVRYPGDHCNIGGGWVSNPEKEVALSNTSLRKMIKRAHYLGREGNEQLKKVEDIFEDIKPGDYPMYSFENFKTDEDAIKSILNSKDMNASIFRVFTKGYWEWLGYNATNFQSFNTDLATANKFPEERDEKNSKGQTISGSSLEESDGLIDGVKNISYIVTKIGLKNKDNDYFKTIMNEFIN